MATNSIAFFDQMNGVNYQTLSSTNYKLGIVDSDSSGLTSSQLSGLEAAGKTTISYLSVGEAETFRSYWQSSWNTNRPSWILGENPDWPGCYQVKFWDPAWQKIIIDKATSLAKAGYDGLMLDVVDVYGVSSVASAAGGADKARSAMIAFVEKISSSTKAINPNFKIIQNNALDLLTVNPDNPSSATNTAHLANIDGVLAETTFYNPNNSKTSWGAWNLQYLDHAAEAGKTVLVIDYPSSASAQQDFISQAISHNFVPFVGNQSLNSIPSVNYQIESQLKAHSMDSVLLSGGSTTSPESPPVVVSPPVVTPPVAKPAPAPSTPSDAADHIIVGNDSANILNGIGTRDQIYGRGGNDNIHGHGGNDYIQGDNGNDIICGDAGNDAIFGNNGNDRLYGGVGNDYIEGNSGDDMLDGGLGNDVLWGGSGNDIIIGGAGNDDLYGNSGNDKFMFFKNSGNDIINDFEGAGSAKGDIIQISHLIYSSKAQILSHISYQDGDAVIHLEGANTITVAGIPDHALTAADFQII